MVSVLASYSIDRRFESRSGQTKNYKIGICCFAVKHAALRRTNKHLIARNQDNVSEWGVMSIHGLLFRWSNTINRTTKRVGLVQSGPHHHLIKNLHVLVTISLSSKSSGRKCSVSFRYTSLRHDWHTQCRAPVWIVLSSSGTSHLGMLDIQTTTKVSIMII